ncbi:MAG: alanine dehydrogenase, partial [Pseudomonadota bacterium]
VPKEIKTDEYRVGLVPGSVRECITNGHKVIVETHAGAGIGFTDEDYELAGAVIVKSAKEIFAKADMIVKVKEPQPQECEQLRDTQILFTYLHLAPDNTQTSLLLASNATAIAYETVTDPVNALPLLTPMSQVAGRLSIQAGAHALEKHRGGRGILLGGVPGVIPADVVVIGAGTVGTNAARMAMGLEARVTVLDKSLKRLKELDFQFGSKLNSIYATEEAIEHYVKHADLVVGAVLVPGAAAPKLVTRKMLKQMRPGAVLVDVAIDQGGCFSTSRPTTHADPTYVVDDIVHYCVANMPAAVPRTAAFALNNATLPFVLALANKGAHKALRDDPHLLNGLNIHKGMLTYAAVADAQNRQFTEPEVALQQ